MKYLRIFTILFLVLPCYIQSWNAFENWGIYKNEKELAHSLMPIITVCTTWVNDNDIKRLVNLLNQRTADSNLDREKVIQALMKEIDIKIAGYQGIQKNGPSYDDATTTLVYAAIFAAISGIYLYKNLTYDQRKKEIEDKLHELGARWVISGGGMASAHAPWHANRPEIKYQLNRLASLDGAAGFWSILSGVGALLCGLTCMSQMLDNKYPYYYEKRFEEIKQMIQSKLQTSE